MRCQPNVLTPTFGSLKGFDTFIYFKLLKYYMHKLWYAVSVLYFLFVLIRFLVHFQLSFRECFSSDLISECWHLLFLIPGIFASLVISWLTLFPLWGPGKPHLFKEGPECSLGHHSLCPLIVAFHVPLCICTRSGHVSLFTHSQWPSQRSGHQFTNAYWVENDSYLWFFSSVFVLLLIFDIM